VCVCVCVCERERVRDGSYVGLAKTIHTIRTHIRCIYGDFSRDNTLFTVIYGVHIRFWPTLVIRRICIACRIVFNAYFTVLNVSNARITHLW
jgi:hypothetical protein